MPPRVLYAEDNDISRDLTQAVLMAAGLDVVAVGWGQAGCDAFGQAAAEQRPFALVLLDMHMPDMTGLAVARAVRAHPQGADVPIVFLTGSVADGDEPAPDELRITLTLLKPVTRTKLATLLGLLEPQSGS